LAVEGVLDDKNAQHEETPGERQGDGLRERVRDSGRVDLQHLAVIGDAANSGKRWLRHSRRAKSATNRSANSVKESLMLCVVRNVWPHNITTLLSASFIAL